MCSTMEHSFRAIVTDYQLMPAGIAENTQAEDCDSLKDAHRAIRRLSALALAYTTCDVECIIIDRAGNRLYETRIMY